MTDIATKIAEAVAEHEAALNQIGGCGDGYCLVTGRAKGMHTNGGCRCWQEKYRAQLAMGAGRRFLEKIKKITEPPKRIVGSETA